MVKIPETLEALAVDIDSVRPFESNPRRGDVKAIAESLRVNGQYRPIVANKRTGEILAGNHTWQAAKSLSWSQTCDRTLPTLEGMASVKPNLGFAFGNGIKTGRWGD